MEKQTIILLLLVLLGVIGAVVHYGWKNDLIQLQSPGKVAVKKFMEDLDRNIGKIANIMPKTRVVNVDVLSNMVAELVDVYSAFETADVSKCPKDFQKHYHVFCDAFEDVTNQAIEINDLRNEHGLFFVKPEVAEKGREMAKRYEDRVLKFFAALMHLNDCAIKYGVEVKERFSSRYTEEQLKQVSLSEYPKSDKMRGKAAVAALTARIERDRHADKTESATAVPSGGAASEPTSPRQPATELTPYIQPVYDGVYVRLAKLDKMATSSSASLTKRKEAAEKTRDFVSHYRKSTFPGDFRGILIRLESNMDDYANLQDDIVAGVDDADFLREVEREHRQEIKRSLSELNQIAAKYGCETTTLPP